MILGKRVNLDQTLKWPLGGAQAVTVLLRHRAAHWLGSLGQVLSLSPPFMHGIGLLSQYLPRGCHAGERYGPCFTEGESQQSLYY